MSKQLLLHINIEARVALCCVVCDKEVIVPLELMDRYHAVPLEVITSRLFDLRPLIEEMIGVEVPEYVECREGNCPQRPVMERYLKTDKKKKE